MRCQCLKLDEGAWGVRKLNSLRPQESLADMGDPDLYVVLEPPADLAHWTYDCPAQMEARLAAVNSAGARWNGPAVGSARSPYLCFQA